MFYNLVSTGNGSNITVVDGDGNTYTADEQHPSFDEIVKRAIAKDESVVDLFDASKVAATRFEKLSERVSVANGNVYFDGDEIMDDVYVTQILQFIEEGIDDWEPLVKFYELSLSNTDEHTRESLGRWLEATKGFTIDEDGYIVGYKGVTTDLGSITHGPAVVDGVAVDGSVPNQPGSVIEMQRSKVEHNPAKGCAVGLHVGTWEYAKGFGAVVLEVRVNPRDVVSVPTDCGSAKMRVSRYTVVRVVDNPYNVAVAPVEDYLDEDEFEEDYDDDDYCTVCQGPCDAR